MPKAAASAKLGATNVILEEHGELLKELKLPKAASVGESQHLEARLRQHILPLQEARGAKIKQECPCG